ncbi:unnamed protein product [Mytilus edulis]|uniref:Uncharacterized protein n=1 Tax=Mytilus edulis TaxID=6550 RepID=A0A8S3T323_MYTED|nr:unnamed protein product [Mytilus edulis]
MHSQSLPLPSSADIARLLIKTVLSGVATHTLSITILPSEKQTFSDYYSKQSYLVSLLMLSQSSPLPSSAAIARLLFKTVLSAVALSVIAFTIQCRHRRTANKNMQTLSECYSKQCYLMSLLMYSHSPPLPSSADISRLLFKTVLSGVATDALSVIAFTIQNQTSECYSKQYYLVSLLTYSHSPTLPSSADIARLLF